MEFVVAICVWVVVLTSGILGYIDGGVYAALNAAILALLTGVGAGCAAFVVGTVAANRPTKPRLLASRVAALLIVPVLLHDNYRHARSAEAALIDSVVQRSLALRATYDDVTDADQIQRLDELDAKLAALGSVRLSRPGRWLLDDDARQALEAAAGYATLPHAEKKVAAAGRFPALARGNPGPAVWGLLVASIDAQGDETAERCRQRTLVASLLSPGAWRRHCDPRP